MDRFEEGSLTFSLDGLPLQLRWYTDLHWLQGYGRVFRVMDQLPSGNLCFGVEGPYGKLFVKYAGARTMRYGGKPQDAIRWLQRSAQLYRAHAHPALIPMLTCGPAGDGFVTVFPWREAQPLRPDPPSDAARRQLDRLPLTDTLKMLDEIYDLQDMLAVENLIAVDFTDEHVLLDFAHAKAWVCDIDLYKEKPAFNTRGRMPGSPRFLAPEEYVMGEALGEDTTVYKLGALAFAFFGDPGDRSIHAWKGPEKLHAVAWQAVQEDRKKRMQTVRAFLTAWRNAVSETNL